MRLLLITFVLFGGLSPAVADLRCGSSLVKTGDWAVEVQERCGEPDYIANYPEALVPGFGTVRSVEHWYYNRGPRHFIRRLVFRDGVLQRQESLGYGFLPAEEPRCKSSDLRQGVSEYEILARCGEPLSKRVTWQLPGSGGVLHPVPIQEWLYEFGRTEFRRVVTFRHGRLLEVTIDDKPH